MDSCIAGRKQERCDEISNEMKSMSIKICWKKNFIEKINQNMQNLSLMWMKLMKLVDLGEPTSFRDQMYFGKQSTRMRIERTFF